MKPPEAFALQMLPCFCLPNHFFNDWLRKAEGTRSREARAAEKARIPCGSQTEILPWWVMSHVEKSLKEAYKFSVFCCRWSNYKGLVKYEENRLYYKWNLPKNRLKHKVIILKNISALLLLVEFGAVYCIVLVILEK